MKILCDFDGVLIQRLGIPRWPYFMDQPPMENAQLAVKELIKRGHEVVVFTSREEKDWEDIKKWLKKYDFPELRITRTKESATMMVDDRCFRFTNWQDICKYIF